jgi:G3E family GTPase
MTRPAGDAAPAPAAPVPVAVVTGALGSGKTTLIRDLMRRPEMEGTALVINEFGEVGLDHLMVSSAVETTLLMENGCLCCSLRGDLVDTVLDLFGAAERGEVPPFRRILIETTGLADPVPIVRDLSGAPALVGKVRLASVATAVDGLLGLGALAADPVALAQVANADLCLVTKADLAERAGIDALTERLGVLNPLMRIEEVRGGKAPPGDPLFADARTAPPPPPERGHHHHHHDHHHHDHHDDDHAHDTPHGGVDTLSITLEQPLPWAALRDWMDLVYSLHAARMLRLKGFLWVAERDGPVLVQAVGPVVSPVELLRDWPEGRRLTRLVMITKSLPAGALRRSFDEFVLSAVADAAPEAAHLHGT